MPSQLFPVIINISYFMLSSTKKIPGSLAKPVEQVGRGSPNFKEASVQPFANVIPKTCKGCKNSAKATRRRERIKMNALKISRTFQVLEYYNMLEH